MRMEVSGAVITTAVVDVIEELQQPGTDGFASMYLRAIDELSQHLLLDPDGDEYPETLNLLRTLALLRRDLQTLASPPDTDDAENDAPTISL